MPSSRQGFAFGDIVLVPFPFTSQATSKQRPAVVVSTRAYAVERPDVVLMAVTSQLRSSPAFGETWLRGWQAAGLLKPSAVKPVFATLEQAMILKMLGSLDPEDRHALQRSIAQILGPSLELEEKTP